MINENIKKIAVFGTSKCHPGDQTFQLACDLGKALAQNSFAIVNGGYGGVMLASAKGAKSVKNSLTIGITCSAFGRSGPNPYIDREIRTANLTERLNTLISTADAYIVLPGGTGTLLELAQVWELKNKNFIPKQKPLIIHSGFWKNLFELVVSADPKASAFITLAENTDDFINAVKTGLSTC